MVPGLKSLPYEQLLIKLRLWSLEERRVPADLIELNKIVNGISGIDVDSFFEYDTNDRTRGHSRKLRKKEILYGLEKTFLHRSHYQHPSGMLLTTEQLHLPPETASKMDWKEYGIPSRWDCYDHL